MFEGFKNKLKGIFTYSRLVDEAKNIFYSHVNDKDMLANHSCWRAASKDPDQWYSKWLAFAEKRLHRIAEADDKFTQAIALRRETVDVTKESIGALTYFDEEYSDEDRILIGKILMPEDSKEKYQETEYYIYAYNDISCSVFRLLSFKLFNDAHAHDWFDLFSDIYKQYIQHTYSSIIANKKDDVYPFQSFVPVLEQQIKQMEEQIYQGHNWEYDKEKIEAENEKEEKQRNLEEEAKKKPKQKTVTNSQIEDLSEYLAERMKRLSRGELYTTPKDDEGTNLYPSSPENALWADLGMMLIALCECVENRETAIQALKKTAIKAYGKYSTDSSINDIDTSIPETFLEVWKENEDDGPLSHLTLGIVKLLYGDLTDFKDLKELSNPEEDDNEWNKTIRGLEKSARDLTSQIGLSILDDVLEVQHYTKKVFGWDVGEYKRTFSFSGEDS